MDTQRLAHFIDGVLDRSEIQSSLYEAAKARLGRTDQLEIESMAQRLRTYYGWTEGEALEFLYRVGVAHLQLEET